MSQPSKISQALSHLFDKGQRIVFWYDEQLGFLRKFEQLDLPGVEREMGTGPFTRERWKTQLTPMVQN